MDNNNWILPLPKREPDHMDTTDWRSHLPPDSRQKIINNITEKLMKHLPSGAEGMNKARTMATRFEDKIFSGAVNQTDYLRKISTKMLLMETKWQNAAGSSSSLFINNANNSLPFNPGQHMDNVDSKPSLPKEEPAMYTYDWRTQLSPDSREEIVNKIHETLKKHLPFAGPEGINELRRMATRFEEKFFSGAVNQTDYLRKISMKMFTMETKAQNAAGSSVAIHAANDSLPFPPGHHMDKAMNTGDWRTHLPPDSRKKNVNKIKETLKKHVPNCGQEGIKELKRIATSFEELIFNTAIDQMDYVGKISFKIQTTREGD